jgi:hypothetical protein
MNPKDKAPISERLGFAGPNEARVQTATNPASFATVGTTSTQLLAPNPSRVALFISNDHATNVLYLRFGTGSAVAASGVRVSPGATFTADSFAGPVQGIASAVTNVGIVEI